MTISNIAVKPVLRKIYKKDTQTKKTVRSTRFQRPHRKMTDESKTLRMQETISLDGFIDRCLSRNPSASDDEIIRYANVAFSYPCLSVEYLMQRRTKIQAYQNQLNTLKKLPHIEQRTKEWYDMRNTMITASDFAQAVGDGKFASQKQFFKKKCGFEDHTFDPMIPPLKWGVMFEPVATSIYERRYSTNIHEFGILRHPDISHFGASPDGITDMGIMLEIKCPYKRKITGEIPLQYFYQIQGQLDVCSLDECDYLECEFEEVYDSEDFFSLLNDPQTFEKGIILEFSEADTEGNMVPKYIYSDIYDHNHTFDLKRWFDDHTSNDEEGRIKPHFWMMKKFNVVRVYKDNEFIKEKFDILKDIWEKVESYKNDKNLYIQDIMTSTRARNATTTAVNAPKPVAKKSDNVFEKYLFDDSFLS